MNSLDLPSPICLFVNLQQFNSKLFRVKKNSITSVCSNKFYKEVQDVSTHILLYTIPSFPSHLIISFPTISIFHLPTKPPAKTPFCGSSLEIRREPTFLVCGAAGAKLGACLLQRLASNVRQMWGSFEN